MTVTPETERTRVIAGSALGFMERHDIPATPENYALWYLHASGEKPALVSEVDALCANHTTFTSFLLDDLRQRYLQHDAAGDVVNDTGARVEMQLSRVMDALSGAGRDAAAYGRILDEAAGGLTAGPKADTRSIIQALLRATQEVQVKNRTLEDSLNSSALEVSNLRENLASVRREAMTDPLTALANRKAFDEALTRTAEEARFESTEFCMLFGDVDRFKTFNDKFGHQLGDQVLKLVARSIMDNIPQGAIGARYGGEEFAVLLPRTSLATAAMLANAIRHSVEQKKVVRRQTGEQLAKITISIGCALYRGNEPLKDFVERADRALYSAKHDGRNLVRLESDLLKARA